MKKLHISFNSPVVLTFVFLSFAVMILNYATGGKSNEILFVTYRSGIGNTRQRTVILYKEQPYKHSHQSFTSAEKKKESDSKNERK